MYKGLQEARNTRVLYVDMNAFFASVEQQFRPELRGRPLGVVSHLTKNGTILAASYPAKRLGIRTGTKVKDARFLCPEIALVETSPHLYRSTHKRLASILQDLAGPEVQVRSIDEAAVPLSLNWQSREHAWELANRIKERFRKELGEYITCSIGIAPNSLLAKLATDLHKPDGLFEITLENTPEVLAGLPLTDLPGIAYRNAARLGLQGISSSLELYNCSPIFLRQQFGWWGQQWWWRLHGYEPDGWQHTTHSFSHQHVLKKWITTRAEVLPILSRMGDRLIHRLCHNQLQCRRVWLALRLSNSPPFFLERQLDTPTGSFPELFNTFQLLGSRLPALFPGQVRMLMIGFEGLVESHNGQQLNLFSDPSTNQSLSEALEHIRSRFGFQAIQLGNVVRLDMKVAQEQIGFGRVKDRD